MSRKTKGERIVEKYSKKVKEKVVRYRGEMIEIIKSAVAEARGSGNKFVYFDTGISSRGIYIGPDDITLDFLHGKVNSSPETLLIISDSYCAIPSGLYLPVSDDLLEHSNTDYSRIFRGLEEGALTLEEIAKKELNDLFYPEDPGKLLKQVVDEYRKTGIYRYKFTTNGVKPDVKEGEMYELLQEKAGTKS